MPLEAGLAGQLKTLLGNLTQPIELVANYGDGPKSNELRDLLVEIDAMSDLVSLRDARPGEIDRAPGFDIVRPGTDVRVGFAGIPMGHEFTSLVLALLQVGGHPPKISEQMIEQIKTIDAELSFETFMALSCQNCPDVVQALNLISIINPKIKATAIDGGVFPAEAEERGVLAVPTVFVDGELFGNGRMSVEDILAKIDNLTGGQSNAAAVAKLDEADPYDVLIIGGGPAGAASAVYAARKGLRTAIVTERFGGQVLDTMSIENLISVPHTEGPRLAADLERHVLEYDVEIIKGQAASGITEAGPDGLIRVALASGATLKARSVVLATGARWRTMGVPGEDDYRNKGVTFCPHCDGPLFKGKRVAVIGGGNSGVEAAIDLAGIVKHVTLVEFLDEMRADEVLQRKLKSLPNVEILLGTKSTEVTGDGARVTGLVHQPRDGGESTTTELEGVFVQIGLLPNTDWLVGSGVELTDRREIIIDERGATSMPGVFAAGDATVTPFKQIVVAMGGGSTAALSAFDYLIRTSAPAEQEMASV